ncbi:S8 family serine peptidase [Kaarinaea lacus]
MDHFHGGKIHPIIIIFKLLLVFVLFIPFTVSSAPFPANHSPRIVHTPSVQKFPPKLVINRNKHKRGELLIKYKEGTSDALIERVNRRLGIPGEKKIDGSSRRRNARRAARSRVDNWRKVTLRPGVDVEQVIEMYANDPNIEYVEPNYEVSIEIQPNDNRFSELWGMHNIGQTGGTPDADIDAPEAWDKFTGADSTIVAVIDTGVDYDHEDLADNMWVNIDEIPDNGLDDDGNGYVDDIYGYDFFNQDSDPFDDHGHGTHCAGTIAGLGDNVTGVTGVNWRTRIMALKFLAAGGYGYIEDAIEAVRYAISMGANIMSNSWGGGGYSQIMADAISDANDAGIVFIAAAGNNSTNNDAYAHYPASYHFPNVISVAATDHNDELATFSNYGIETVHLSAPGVNILSTVPLSGCVLCDASGYLSISGTSMATPHVAGAAALLLGMQPELDPIDVRNLIMDTADRIENLSDKTISGARLNINSMISAIPSVQYLPLIYPKRRSVRSGESTTFDIDVKSFGTFSGPVALAVESPDPQNISISIEPNVVIPPAGESVHATMTVSTLVDAYDGDYDLLIRATDESGNEQATKTRLVVDAIYMLPGDIGGYVTKDITLKANSDYHVISDLIVNPGATITIEEGAHITFDSNARLKIEGGLVISGTEENPVTFTSSSANPTPGNWYGIYISNSAVTSEIRHVVVEWSNWGIFVEGSDVSISDSIVRDFQTSGISLMWGASGEVRNNIVQRAGWPGTGIQVQDSNNVILQGNDIQNVYTGLAFIGRVDTLVIGNNVQNNNAGISISSAESNVIIRDGNVISNNYTGIWIGNNRAKPIINNNEIANNTQLNLRISHSGYLPDKYAEIDVRNNWWGTTDVNVISSKILDRSRSYPDYASALFTPYLDNANGNPVTTNYLEGVIRSNKTIGPGVHVVAGTLRVVPGATLHIEAGAVLQFVSTGTEEALIVDGSLLVEGAADNPVRITSNLPTPAISDWYGIKLTESSFNNIIQHASFTYANTALLIESDNTIVDHVKFENTSFGIHISNASVTVSNNLLQDTGILMEYGASGLIENNTISLAPRYRNWSSKGISLRNASPTIRGNRIEGFGNGINMDTDSEPLIEGNQIESNSYGINVYHRSHPIIRDGNKIINNTYGINIGVASNAVINDNSIYNNTAYNIYAGARQNDGTIDATRNWWGTADAADIATSIFDIKNSDAYTSYALVQFVPYLDAENGNFVSDPGIINGLIETDTTWSEGVYTLVNGLPIATGATLTVEPGAELRFVDDTGIVADGRLLMAGDENNPIRLVSTNTNALGQDWTGITIKSTSEDSIISHVVIDAADTAITINGNNTTVSNVKISKARTGIKVDGATVDILNNTINTSSGSYRTGIRLDYGAGGVIKDNEIVNTTLSNNSGIGVKVDYHSKPKILNGIAFN